MRAKRAKLILLLFLCLSLASTGVAQKRKKTPAPSRGKSVKPEPVKPIAPTVGTTVHIITKNGDKLSGALVDISAFSVRFKANNLESTLAMETIASISFGAAKDTDEKKEPTFSPVGESFKRAAAAVLGAFQTMAAETKTGSSYTEYDRQLVQLRRAADKFIQANSASENPSEARSVALFSGALLDYNAARTIWTLKIGSNGTLSENDSPVVADTLTLYPELRAQAAAGDRFSADKLIGNLWKKAAEKVNLVQAMMK